MNETIDWGRIGRLALHGAMTLAIALIISVVVITEYSERHAVASCSARQLKAVESPGYGWICVSFEKAVRP
jgi:hypothetical protein